MRTPTLPLMLLLFCCSLFGTSSLAQSGHRSGLPTPQTILHAPEARVPFVVPESFPVPVVEVSLNGSGPWRLVVDTAMGGTVMLRKELIVEMGLPVVGQALVGDSSGTNLKPADLVQIDSMRLGDLEVNQIIGIGFAAGEAHLKDVPDDIHGILGNRIYAELLMTLDYPAGTVVFRAGELAADDASVIEFKDEGNVMVVEIDLAGVKVPVIVDSGSRGSITLPESLAEKLSLHEGMREIESVSTVSNTYQRKVARLDGQARLAGATWVDPEIDFSDEHTPKLLGYQVLKDSVITIDQAHGRLQWSRSEIERER